MNGNARRSVGSSELARRLGLDESRVRRLAASGKLPARKVGHDWLFEIDLIGSEFSKDRSRGRPFSRESALGVLFLASGADAPWLTPAARSRLRRRLKDVAKMRPRLRSRGERRLYSAPASLLRDLRKDQAFVQSGVSASERYGMRIASQSALEGYADASLIDRLTHRYALERVGEREANLVVHVVPRRLLPDGRVMPIAVVAADLADYSDERTRSVGDDWLRRYAS